MTFGPAVIAAYKLEGKAKYSRILIDEKICLPEENSIIYYRDPEDGYLCLNPIGVILSDPISYVAEGEVYPEGDMNEIISNCFLKQRKMILKQISRYKNTTVIDKYLWRVKAFNYTCNLIIDIPNEEVIYKKINFVSNQQLKELLKNQLIVEEDILKC
ncbi:MAG: hypothetical protein IJN27_02945 [Oscillospiraceae bacterium]|nr:hypothetical protein [Oscillospiraceae bacterium]